MRTPQQSPLPSDEHLRAAIANMGIEGYNVPTQKGSGKEATKGTNSEDRLAQVKADLTKRKISQKD
jgi:hypothetical protein